MWNLSLSLKNNLMLSTSLSVSVSKLTSLCDKVVLDFPKLLVLYIICMNFPIALPDVDIGYT